MSNQHVKTDSVEPKIDTLYVSDQEIYRRLGIGEKNGRAAVRELERAGFPRADPLFAGKRYWPAIVRFLDRRAGICDTNRIATSIDGEENWK